MTLGDIIEKFLGLFGVKPARQRKLIARIESVKQKIAEMEENRNTIMRSNNAIGDKIAELKRQLQVETNPNNQDLIMDQVDELEKEFERKRTLSQQMTENIAAQRAIRAKCEQLLEQVRHAADPAEIEMLMEQVEDMLVDRGEAKIKIGELDKMGQQKRSAKGAKSEDAARAARRAAMLGTATTAPAAPAKAAPAVAPAAPAPAAPEPTVAPASAEAAPADAPAVAAG